MPQSPEEQFENRYQIRFEGELGGVHGIVKRTGRGTAVKNFKCQDAYERERDAYLLLGAAIVPTILGHRILDHNVPQLLHYDDELLKIEMTIVTKPFFLDFAGAYRPEQVPDFPPEVWDERRTKWIEEFGEKWPHVERLLTEFHRLTGMVLLDVNRGNIAFLVL